MQTNNKSMNSSSYISSAWQQHAELVAHLCHFSQNILLILGQAESGKSTFFEYLTTQPSIGLRICALKATFNEDVESLLQEVARGFALDWENRADTSVALRTKAIAAYQQAHETWVLVIDDAHLLNDEQIAALLQLVQFNEEARAQLHLVLLGESSLEARLFAPILTNYAQGKVYSIELEPWTLHDLKRYFARNTAIPPLTSEQIADIYARTRGVPGQVIHEERLQQNSFIEGASTMTKQSAKRWTHPIVLGAVAGFLLGGAYLLLNSTQEEEMMNAPANAAQVEEGWERNATNKPRIDNSDEKVAMEEEPAPIVQSQVAMPSPAKVSTAAIAATQETAVTTPAPIAAQDAPAVTAMPAQTNTVTSQAVTQTNAAAETVIKAADNTQTIKQVTPPTEKVPTPAKARSKEEEHLLSVDKHYYTLQLVGARNEKSVQQYIQKNQLEEYAYSYHTKLSGKDWYVVVLGEYPSMEEAKAAAADLPSHIAAKPWIREFNSIHKDIQKQG